MDTTDDALRAADKILLVDPNRPGWVTPLLIRSPNRGGVTLEIPVDSRNQAALLSWRKRLRDLGLDG